MVNLLPPSARERVISEYRLRLASVSAWCAAGAVSVGIALLVPSYLSAKVEKMTVERQKALIEQSLARSSLAVAGSEVKAAQFTLAAVTAQASNPRPTSSLGPLLSAKPQGISLRRVEYAYDEGTVVRLSGAADTREHLLAYKQALAALPETSVDLPLDNLAKAQNISFVITVIQKKTP